MKEFDFDKYNELMKTANTGLKLHFATQLCKNVLDSLEYFDNPLEADLRPVYTELKAFQRKYKEVGKQVAAKKPETRFTREALQAQITRLEREFLTADGDQLEKILDTIGRLQDMHDKLPEPAKSVSGTIDNATLASLTNEDMLRMMEEFRRRQSPDNAGTAVQAAADRGINEIAKGITHRDGDGMQDAAAA